MSSPQTWIPEGLVERCAEPVTSGCPIYVDTNQRQLNCPRVKQVENTLDSSAPCYDLYDVSRYTTEQRQIMMDAVFSEYCENCKNNKDNPAYSNCMDACTCILRNDPVMKNTYDKAKSEMSALLKGKVPEAHCWWKSCVNASTGISNPYLVDSGDRGECPTTMVCDQSVTTTAKKIIGNKNINIKTLCPTGLMGGACDTSHPATNMLVGDCGDKINNHETCTRKCKPGYQLTGTTSCKDGTLTDGRCDPQQCDTFAPTNGIIAGCKNIQEGDVCSPVCDYGYELQEKGYCRGGNFYPGRCGKPFYKVPVFWGICISIIIVIVILVAIKS